MDSFTPSMIHLPESLNPLFYAKGHKADCPSCERPVHLRPVTLSKKILNPMLELSKEHEIITPEMVKNRFDEVAYTVYTKPKYWGFLERTEFNGLEAWRVTDQGRQFCAGKIVVPEVMWIYKDVPRFVTDADLYGRWVSVHDLDWGEETNRHLEAAKQVPIEVSSNHKLV